MTRAPETPLIELRGVHFAYGQLPVLEGVDLQVPRGRVTALIGPMGSGKTTTLRLIGGEQRADRGQVLFDGADVGAMDTEALYAVRRRMGVLFQFGALFADLSVFDNVAFPLREHAGLPESLVRDIVLMKLEAVGLRGARGLMPGEVSGGMARRIALARALALDPDLIMVDEPFSGLDPISLRTVAQLLRQLTDSLGLSCILVSHELSETLSIADHVIVLANGRVAFQGPAGQVRTSDDPMVRQYVQALPDGPMRFHYPGASLPEDFGFGGAAGR